MNDPLAFWSVLKNTALWWSPIVAGFIGAFGVHLLTQSREREKWILDSKKQEYRELLSALSQAYITTIELSPGFAGFTNDPHQHSSIWQIQNESLRLFADRIFIKTDVDLETLKTKWRDGMNKYSFDPEWSLDAPKSAREILTEEYDSIRDQIVAAATRSVPKTTKQRLMFWNS